MKKIKFTRKAILFTGEGSKASTYEIHCRTREEALFVCDLWRVKGAARKLPVKIIKLKKRLSVQYRSRPATYKVFFEREGKVVQKVYFPDEPLARLLGYAWAQRGTQDSSTRVCRWSFATAWTKQQFTISSIGETNA